MKERIEKIMKMEQLSASKFADAIGVQRSNISHVLSGRNKPSLELINKILDHFEEINADWLLLGKGPMTETMVIETQVNSGINTTFDLPALEDNSFKPNDKKPTKIVIFYEDGTFEQYRPT